jgi:voltage-gated potassium channel
MRLRLVERRVSRFLSEPVSVRGAVGLIVWFMSLSVVLGGVVVWVFDRVDFPGIADGLWWSLQTVTTVGYGDVVPTTPVGRLAGAVIMLESIAFISILTAVITSSFVERAREKREPTRGSAPSPGEIAARLDAIESAIRALKKNGG